MAKLDRSFVIVRFRFGEANVKGRQRNLNTYRIVENIAFTFAENQYEALRGQLQEGVKSDIQRELVNMASLYRRHIIGANGNTARPAGVIRSVIGGAAPLALASALPAWAPRSATYLARKFNARAGNGWFDNRGWSRRRGQKWEPSETGLLFEKTRADVWEQMFGPISVRFRKSAKLESKDVSGTFNLTGSKSHVQVQLGRLSVYALGEITPDMLPGLAAGRVGMASDRGNDNLMGLVQKYDERLAYRLGQRSSGTKRYRPTLEPFLGYFLTRSIPAAIQRRIAQGSLSRITRSS